MARSTVRKRGCHVARTIGNSPLIVYVSQQSNVAQGNMLIQVGPSASAVRLPANFTNSNGLPKAGAMVWMSASRVIRCFPATTTATSYDVAASNLLGLLLENVTASSMTKVAIAAAVPDTIFETSLVSTTATTTATTTASLVGFTMTGSVTGSAFYLSRTGTPALLQSSSSPFLVVDVPSEDGAYNGRVQFVCRYSIWGNGKMCPIYT